MVHTLNSTTVHECLTVVCVHVRVSIWKCLCVCVEKVQHVFEVFQSTMVSVCQSSPLKLGK